ncbi:unnamed protein product [Rhodiola kirilowii]
MGDLEDMPTPESSASAADFNNSSAKFSDPTGARTVNGARDSFTELPPEEVSDKREEISFQNSADSVNSSRVDENIRCSSLTGSKSEPNILWSDEVSLPKVKALSVIEYPESAKSGAADSPTGLQRRNVELPNRSNSIDSSRVVVDTAAPIESVKDAVSKFGGIVDWKTHKVQALERCRHIDQELEKTQEAILECRKMSQAAEDAKVEVLTELERTMKQIDELEMQLSSWSLQIQEQRKTTEIAELQPDDVHQVTADESDAAAAKQEVEAIVAQHEAALTELKFLKEELEAEKTVIELTAELGAARESLELDAAQAEFRDAEDQSITSIVASEQHMSSWESEMKQVEAEVEKLNQEYLLAKDLKSKLDSASALVSSLKTELASSIKSKMKQENVDDVAHSKTEVENSKMELEKELEMVKLRVEKATAEVRFLKMAASSLQSEIEKEKKGLAAIKKQGGIAMVSVQSLEAELSMINSEIGLVEMRKKEAREKLVDLPNKLQQVAEEADHAKSYKQAVEEELRRVRDEAEQVKAEACTSESRLDAAKKEIEATKASEKLALAAIDALQETETSHTAHDVDSANVVAISLEEYQALGKRAQEAEEKAKMRIIAAFIQLEETKKSESTSLQKLKEVNQEFTAKKEAYATATKKSERAMSDKLSLEQELRAWRTRNVLRRKASESACVTIESVIHPVYSPRSIKQRKDARKSGKVVATEPLHHTPSTKSAWVDQGSVEYDSFPDLTIVKRKKRSIFPRLLMFFGRRKTNVLKKVL